MSQPSVAVIGAGVMGSLHANVVGNHPAASLSAVVDIDRSQAERVAAEYEAAAATEAGEVIQSAEACVIATPEPTHADLTERCLD